MDQTGAGLSGSVQMGRWEDHGYYPGGTEEGIAYQQLI